MTRSSIRICVTVLMDMSNHLALPSELRDSACRYVQSSPFVNQNDMVENKDDFVDESMMRVKEKRARDARNILIKNKKM